MRGQLCFSFKRRARHAFLFYEEEEDDYMANFQILAVFLPPSVFSSSLIFLMLCRPMSLRVVVVEEVGCLYRQARVYRLQGRVQSRWGNS